MKKPKIAITLGDPLGIGAEITAKALKNPKIKKLCTPILIGDIGSLEKYGFNKNNFLCIDTLLPTYKFAKKPCPSKLGGLVSFKAVKLATKLGVYKKVDAIVTAPICKKSWDMAGVAFTGHTDFFRKFCKSPDALMIFISKNIRCALLTEHIPLQQVSKFITKQKIISMCRNFKKALQFVEIKNPRIAFCGLNPHLGDRGSFAKEEEKIIKPALKKIKNVTLLPADTAWQKHTNKTYDAIICCYHDQALIPLKTICKSPIVHWTYRLPFVRTSPTHGTAFDIADKNIADPSSMVEAILFAVKNSRATARQCRC